MSTPEIIRVLIVSYGAGFGKSSLVSRFVHNAFDSDYFPTVGDIESKTLTIDGERVVVQILDTSGDPDLCQTSVDLMKFADAFMVVYDTSQPGSLQSCLPLRCSILQEKGTNQPTVLVGTKTDLKRRIRRSHGRKMAESWECPFFETSSREDRNVQEAFESLIHQHLSNRRPLMRERTKSKFLSNAFPLLRSWDIITEQITDPPSPQQDSIESQPSLEIAPSLTRERSVIPRVLKSGWLHKRGYVHRNWKFRFVMLYDDGVMQYFNGEEDERPLGEFNLKDVWQVVDYRTHGHEDAFVLQTVERDWYFSFLNETQREAWLNVIVRRIAHFAAERTTAISISDYKESDIDFPVQSESEMLFEKSWSLHSTPSEYGGHSHTSSLSSLASLGADTLSSVCSTSRRVSQSSASSSMSTIEESMSAF